MKLWATKIKALDPFSGEMKTWIGENIQAPTWDLAQQWCNENGRGYLEIVGELIAEIPEENGEPDFDNTIHYDKIQLN